MTTVIYLNELSCPDCAEVLVEKIKKIKNIDEVVFDFSQKKLQITSKKSFNKNHLKEFVYQEAKNSYCSIHCNDDTKEGSINIMDNDQNKFNYEFSFKNIDCPNCAAKVERALNDNKNIINANVNFMTKKIMIQANDDIDCFSLVNDIIHRFEPNAIISKEKQINKETILTFFKKWFPSIIGVIIFIIAILCHHVFKTSTLLYYNLYIASYIFLSYELLIKAGINIIHGEIFDENLLMLIATIGAFAIKEPFEAIMVVLLYKIGEALQDHAVDKSKDAITSLVAMKVDEATMVDGTIKKIEDINIGDEVIIKVGERIPLDGKIIQGKTTLDIKALTGESLPIFKDTNDDVLSGSINLSEVITMKVSHRLEESTMTKVLKLVDEASNQKSKTEKFITKFAKYYTPIVLLLAIVVFFVRYFALQASLTSSLNTTFTFLTISCPCALVISIPLSFFAGIGRFSKSGILIKGGNYMEALLKSDIVVMDKTGTLTKGNFHVKEVVTTSNMESIEILETLAHVEYYSNHPIAKSILQSYNKPIDEKRIKNVKEKAGYGISCLYNGKKVIAGNDKYLKYENINNNINNIIGTIVYLVVEHKMVGYVVIEDEIKPEAKHFIDTLKQYNKETMMLTGDNEQIAQSVASSLSINHYYSQLLPDQKLNHLKELKKNNHHIIYIGDGINDTPSLKLADVGIAMGGCGSDVAVEAADVVVMNDNLTKITEAISISKHTKKIIVENICFALLIKLIALVIGVIGVLGAYAMLLAVFSDVGVALLAVLNSMRILKKKNFE